MKRKSAIAIMLAITTILTGCGNKEIALTDNAEEVELEVSWWGSDDRSTYTMEALREYEKNNSNIKVNMTYGEFSGFEMKNDVKMFARTEADIMQINYAWVEKYQKEGLTFYDMNQLKDQLDLSQYDETVLSYGKNDKGEQIALPIALNVEVAWYNKALYSKYGLDLPETWDDLFKAAEKMKADGVYPIDMDSSVAWQAMVAYAEQSTGHKVFDQDNKFTFTQDDVKLMISFYKELVDKGVVEKMSDRDENKIADGVYAGTLQWLSSADKVSGLIGKAGGETAAVLAPGSGESNPGWYVKPATFYVISSHTKNPKDAGKLLNYMVSDKGMVSRQLFEKGVPSNKKALEILDGEGKLTGIQYDASVLAEKKNYPLMSPYFEVKGYQEALKSGIELYLYGKADLDDAAAQTFKAMSDI